MEFIEFRSRSGNSSKLKFLSLIHIIYGENRGNSSSAETLRARDLKNTNWSTIPEA